MEAAHAISGSHLCEEGKSGGNTSDGHFPSNQDPEGR